MVDASAANLSTLQGAMPSPSSPALDVDRVAGNEADCRGGRRTEEAAAVASPSSLVRSLFLHLPAVVARSLVTEKIGYADVAAYPARLSDEENVNVYLKKLKGIVNDGARTVSSIRWTDRSYSTSPPA